MLLQGYIHSKDISADTHILNNPSSNIIKVINIVEGRGSALVNDCVYSIEEGNVFIVDSRSIYYFTAKPELPFRVNILMLERDSVFKMLESIGQSFDDYCGQAYVLQGEGRNKVNDVFSRISLFEKPSDVLISEKLLTLLRVCTENSKNASLKNTAVNKILNYINENLCSHLDLNIISENLHSSVWYLCHSFKETTGFTIKEYVRLCRIHKAEKLLTETDYSISNISEMCGFESPSVFSRIFLKGKGVTASAYRKRNSLPYNTVNPKKEAPSHYKEADKENKIDIYSPIIPIFEYSTIDLGRVYLSLFQLDKYSGENFIWQSDEPNLIFDNQKHLLTVGAEGVYRAYISYRDIKRDIAICVIPRDAATKSDSYEATLFEYNFENKSTDDILKHWIFQERPNNVSSFLPPQLPKRPLNRPKSGFIPFPAAYRDEKGDINYSYFNFPKGPTDVGFMYLREEYLPSLFSDYKIYFSGTLTALAKNVPNTSCGSAAAKVGIIGRIKTSSENIIDYSSQYQASLVSVAKHPFCKLRGQEAHNNIFLTDKFFFEFGYDSDTPKYFAADADEIKVGDDYSVTVNFTSTDIITGIKKGSLNDGTAFLERRIHSECSQLTNGANYMRSNRNISFSAKQGNLCTSTRGTVGFAYMGAETALKIFKVTHTVSLLNIPTIPYINAEKISELVKKRAAKAKPPHRAEELIPKRKEQKPLNARSSSAVSLPEGRICKFTILSNMQIQHDKYFNDFESSATAKKNFFKYINSSDTEFLISCGDNLEQGYNYTYESCISACDNLSAFYNLMTNLPDKDCFVLKGNRDSSIGDFADRFIIDDENITVIGFSAKYIQYNKVKNRTTLSSGMPDTSTIEWLGRACENAIKKNPDTHIIFACHYSVINYQIPSGFFEDGSSLLASSKIETSHQNELLDIITAYGVEFFISGHENTNEMYYKPVCYHTGYNTGCINYIAGNTPIDCTMEKSQDNTSVTLEQYFYGDFVNTKTRTNKNLIKSVSFELNHPNAENRLKNAHDFLAAKKLLSEKFNERFDGLYRYSFAYHGLEKINSKQYFKFDVSVLKYHIQENVTIYADSDEDTDGSALTSHLLDAYIPTDAAFVGRLTEDGIKPID